VLESGGEIVIRGHVAKANPHWQFLEKQPECLTIFHGAHSYISPSLYATMETVPTWNYGAVHAHGNARLFSTPEALQEMLDELIAMFEPAYGQQWAGLKESYRQRMLGHIVGFEITATRVEAKFKLSQNRTPQEQDNIISALSNADDSAVSGVAQLMREQRLGSSKLEASTKKDGK
jgi:transcriptional regulator